MDDTTLSIAIGCLVILVFYWWKKRREGLPYPPGPLGLPLVGYIPFMTRKPHVKLHQLRKKYGPVYSLRLGSIDVIVLDDYASIKKAFSQDTYMGRPVESPFLLSKDSLESGAFNGLPWKEQRRVCLQSLRDVGFGKTRMEEHIKEEIKELLDGFEASNGEPMTAVDLLTPSMTNNIASLVFGHRMTYDNPRRLKLDKMIAKVSDVSGKVTWQIFFPTLGKIMRYFQWGMTGELQKWTNIVGDFIREEIEDHVKTLDPNNVRDFIDGYLLEIQKRPDDPAFKKTVLQDLVGAFFGAGGETVRITVDWLMLTMAAHPDVQQRVQAEIDDVIGRERLPSSADRSQMPFTEAAIFEVMRWITILPLNLLRFTLADSELNGYFIPKNTTVLANLWGVHHDEELWGKDTELFKPQRFLTDDGKALKKIDYLIPFSSGRRSCPGEGLARVEVFLYFAAVLQKFHISLPEGQRADFEGNLGIGLMPKRQKLRLRKRF